MPATITATTGPLTGSGRKRLYTPYAVAEAARPGMRLSVARNHDIAMAVQDKLPEEGPEERVIPPIPHDTIFPDEVLEKLERLVIAPTVRPTVGPCKVMMTGPTGCGKTTAARYCAHRIHEERDGKFKYFDLTPGEFRRKYLGDSEEWVRLAKARVERAARDQGCSILVLMDDGEINFMSRQGNVRNDYGCGTTVANVTNELLHLLTDLGNDPDIAVTLLSNSNFGLGQFDHDPAATASHRLRGEIVFPLLDPSLVPEVVRAHAEMYEVNDGVAEWLIETLTSDIVLARGRRSNVSIEVRLADCLLPNMVGAILYEADGYVKNEKDPNGEPSERPIEIRDVASACVVQLNDQVKKIVGAGKYGRLGMIVPDLRDAGDVELEPVFEAENALLDDASLTEAISGAAGF